MIANQIAPPPTFLQEASQLLQQIDAELPTLRQNFSIQKAHTLMRLTHTLKGAAATVGLDAIKTTTQTLENAFKALCVPDAKLTSVVEGLIFDSYDCLKLLFSVQLNKTAISEFDILERMTGIVSKLQENLGDQFGQDGQLPTSTQLGVDVTQSIFESGVTEYLDELEHALEISDAAILTDLLQAQADVFVGLAESLRLPGFGDIAQATLVALQQQPVQVVTIAQLALVDYRAGQAAVLQGDRTQGGTPSTALKQLGHEPIALKKSWIRNLWKWLNQPISLPRWSPQSKNTQNSQIIPLVAKIQPLNTVFHHCRQVLNECTQQQGKPVDVQVKGGEVLVDQTLLNSLYAPLLHLVRHAFEQDIEIPAVRRQQGKSTVGTIQLAARQVEDCLVICIWNDGCGSNPNLICKQLQPQIKALLGKITVTHRPQRGTCFTLRLPTEL
ncbi:Hpt domain-containing protein [Leptothoe spongobia]|uniref:Hpt domain-containing protein n=1 Tax=Leptothoe spongobia TAU-MAC 1115 TaxID=1967444 RepID=A0A947GRC1_9CYAN|nr:Hpt domain-containing protein [Leptothoe spongobia]MBT9317426.1 Hpt domain-containing protein [Leptothoe spongobia TAU-MAC 1115]